MPSGKLIASTPATVALDPAGRPINLQYTPLLVPGTASVRGIELSGGARIYERGKNHYLIGCGCALINTTALTRIDACRLSIFARPNASVVVHSEQDVTRVLNLSDRHRASVRVLLGKFYVDLSPGEEIGIVAGGTRDPKQLVTGDVLGYRNLKIVSLGDGLKVAIWEFSLGDALKQCYIFRQLKQSPEQADHKLLGEIIKTAAAVDTMFKKTREAYSHGQVEPKKPGRQRDSRLAERADIPSNP